MVGMLSYASAAVLFLLLTILLAANRSGQGLGTWLIAASAVNAVWGAFLSLEAGGLFAGKSHALWYVAESLRCAAWLSFMSALLYGRPRSLRLTFEGKVVLFTWLSVLSAGLSAQAIWPGQAFGPGSPVALIQMGGLLALSVVGLVLVEQLVRNTRSGHSYSLKHLYIALGLLFAFDVLAFAVGFMFRMPNSTLWDVRGVANALTVPLIALSASRNAEWSTRVFVSRHVVFYTSSLLAAGGILVLVSAGGYYVRLYGGSWGEFVQILMLLGALLGLTVLAASKDVRTQIRVFIVKHFYSNRYDYREEWLRFMDSLGRGTSAEETRLSLVVSIGGIVESRGGLLFERRAGVYRCTVTKNVGRSEAEPPLDDPLINVMAARGWIIDIARLVDGPDKDLISELPAWLLQVPEARLIVPLGQDADLIGWIVLLESMTTRELNWEDWDLLKTTGRAAAAQLALVQTSEALSEARQFEAFHRLSAFVVHDIKNVIAQLSLVTANANRHLDNPDFVKDAMVTVENAVHRMTRLLSHLRVGRVPGGENTRVILDRAVGTILENCRSRRPEPELRVEVEDVSIFADPEPLRSVIEQLVQNAQEATPDDGRIVVSVGREGHFASICVEDNGCGMDDEFVRERLFKPFDTTKGNAGMGVGAYQVREFVRGIGGEVRVKSSEGEGTRFEVLLPLAGVCVEVPDEEGREFSGG